MKAIARSMVVTGCLAALVAGCNKSESGPSESSGPVKYRVSGTTARASLTYSNASGGTSQVSGATLPWAYDIASAKSGQFLYISAQNDLATGCLTAEIYKGTALFKTSTSCGAYVIASASGSY